MPAIAEPPVTAPAPSPAPEPARSEPPSAGDFDKHFSDLDTSPPPPAPSDPPAPAAGGSDAPPKGRDPTTGKFVPKPEPAAKPVAPVEPDDDSVISTGTMTQVRGWAIREQKRNKKAQQEIEDLKTKVQELSGAGPTADIRALTEQLADYKKKVDDYENEARLKRFETSDKYKNEFQKPYDNAVAQAYSEIKELTVSEPVAEGEEPRERAATRNDFDEIYNLPLGQATKLPKQKLGDSSLIVLQHRKAIKDAAKAALGAIAEHKAKGATYEQAQTAQQKMEQEGKDRMFSTAVQAI